VSSKTELNIEEIALQCAETVAEKKAEYIKLYKVNQEQSILADYFLICSARPEPHIKAVCREVETIMQEQYELKTTHVDGVGESRWVVLDYGFIIVHVFHPELRELYNIEELWDVHEVIYDNENVDVPEYSIFDRFKGDESSAE
jgi:ribosome-associated protein